MGYNSRWDDDEDIRPQHSMKKKREKHSDYGFEASASNKKCKQCAYKNTCDQSNAQRCKRFSNSRYHDDDDY